MNLKEETITVTFFDMSKMELLFELKPGGLVVMTEEDNEARAIGRIPDEGEPWERDFHEWCARYVHEEWRGRVFLTESTVEVGHVR